MPTHSLSLSKAHTHTRTLFIDVCHGFDYAALLLIITERKITTPALSGSKIKHGTQ